MVRVHMLRLDQCSNRFYNIWNDAVSWKLLVGLNYFWLREYKINHITAYSFNCSPITANRQ